jgi:2-polyprenyl-3-methyl-5-hydroxy-6-metoxy-1,4-benzoquinol methylase
MLFHELEKINVRPRPFEFYTASDLWTDEHTSKQMLSFHLNESIDVSSRNAQFIRESVDWIVSHFGLSGASSVADFGCGPGLYATQLARHHIKVTGIDFSERSIQHAIAVAERSGLSINYVHRNYLEFETEERFDLISMIMCDFCALSPMQRKTMLDKFASLLKPNGHVLQDVYSLAGFAQKQEAVSYEENQLNGFWSPNRYYGFSNTFKYREEKVVLEKYTIVEPDRIRTVYNWFQHFSPETIKAEFSSSGLKVIDFYSDVTGKAFDPQSAEFAVVAGLL